MPTESILAQLAKLHHPGQSAVIDGVQVKRQALRFLIGEGEHYAYSLKDAERLIEAQRPTRRRHAAQLRELGWHELADLLERYGSAYVLGLVEQRARPGASGGAPYERETLRAVLTEDAAALTAANETPAPEPSK